jgi:predicted transcriptional regulator
MADKLSKVTTLDRAAAAARFDYDLVDPERRDALREDARQIRLRLIETAGAMMDIGERLVRSRSVLPHGTWLPWLAVETGMSVQWARNCINLFLRFADQPLLLSDLDLALPPTAIIRLVAAPEAAWEDVVDRVREGEKLRVVDVEDVIKDHREREKAAEGKAPRVRSSVTANTGAVPAVDALRKLADRARDELIPRTVERMRAMLQVLEAAEERLTTGPKVTATELQKLREDAQWLADALEQLTQRRADSRTHLVHKTFLDRSAYEPGPWADVAAFLADIASSEDCAATIRKAGPADFVRRGVKVLRGVLSSPSPEPAQPKLPKGLGSIEDALRMDCIVCLEDGKKVQDLGEHLATLGVTPQDYRRKWGLPAEYPMQSPRQIMRHGATFEVDYETGAMHRLTIEADEAAGSE